MMKSYVLMSTLFAACATSSLMSMDTVENKKERLNFLLNHEWQIKASSAQNMEYEFPRSDFLGKKITEAVPLSERDVIAVSKAITDAAQNQRTERVAYTLNNKGFLAKITPIIKANEKNDFFVKVTSLEENVAIND